MARASVCEAEGCGFKPRRPPQRVRRMKAAIETKKIRIEGGVQVSDTQTQKALQVLRDFDRMLENPDAEALEAEVERLLTTRGLLSFVVFVCPRFNPDALQSTNPEEYIPTDANKVDLFEPRVRKIQELRERLLKAGVVSTLDIVIGDNDAENYILPFLPITVNMKIWRERQRLYAQSFEKRLEETFGGLYTVWSLGDLDISLNQSDPKPVVERGDMTKELRFFQWLFSKEGPYKGTLVFDQTTLEKMVQLKFQLYGNQGTFLEELEGILLQTEGPGLWLQRTRMFRCTGAKAVPAIYPWIRKEELKKGD